MVPFQSLLLASCCTVLQPNLFDRRPIDHWCLSTHQSPRWLLYAFSMLLSPSSSVDCCFSPRLNSRERRVEPLSVSWTVNNNKKSSLRRFSPYGNTSLLYHSATRHWRQLTRPPSLHGPSPSGLVLPSNKQETKARTSTPYTKVVSPVAEDPVPSSPMTNSRTLGRMSKGGKIPCRPTGSKP